MTSASPPLRLLTGPAGSGKTTRALARIRDAASTPGPRGRGAARPGEALLVLPTYAQALHVQRVALSRWDARAVLDDPFATFTSAGERFLDGFRVRALPTAEERDSLMAEACRRAAVEVFEPVRERTGFRARLLRLVKEVKQSGQEPAEAKARLEAGASALPDDARQRLDGFLRVFEHYQDLLARASLEDHEDTLRRLLEQLRSHPPVRPPRVLVVDGFDDFTPVEQGILDALSDAVCAEGGEVLVTLPWDTRRPHLFAASAPARTWLLGRDFVEERLEGFPRAEDGSLARIAKDLFAPWTEEGCAPAPTAASEEVRLVVAGDPEDEAEAVARCARALMRDGGVLRGWRDLGVVVRRLDEAGPRLMGAFDRLGIPHRLVGAGRPLAAEGLVRAVRAPLEALVRRSEGDVAASLLDAPALTSWLRWRAWAQEEPEAGVAADRMEIRWRKEGFPEDLATWLAVLVEAGLDTTVLEHCRTDLVEARGADAVYAALEAAILVLGPLPRAGGLTDDGRVKDAEADHARMRAAAARDRLVGLVRGLARAAARTGLGTGIDAHQGCEALAAAIDQARLALPDRRLDVVSILDAEEARFWELPVVFVAGLAQGSFPLRPAEDVLLRDQEREAIRESEGGLALPLARDREARERRLFYGAVTRARRRLVLFRPGSKADGDVCSPSLFLRDLARVVDLDASCTYRPTGRAAPNGDECFTHEDWALFAAARARDPAVGSDEREVARALLALGDPTLERRAARWRLAGADAVDALPDARERFGRSVARVSSTTLNGALACRYRHFLRAVVGVPDDVVPFAGPTFGFREEGTLLHEALRRALLEPDLPPEEVVARVFDWAEDEGQRDVVGLGIEERDRQARELARVVSLFRDRERCIASPFQPLPEGLELAFGTGDAHVGIGEGVDRVELRGRIDRVDVYGQDALVIDYKRSGTSVESASKALTEGTDVQLPLYATAIEQLFDVRVRGFEWVAATARARRGRWDKDAGALYERRREAKVLHDVPHERFRALIDDAIDRSLDVVAALRRLEHDRQEDDAKRCGRCPVFSVCRPAFVRGRRPFDTEGEG